MQGVTPAPSNQLESMLGMIFGPLFSFTGGGAALHRNTSIHASHRRASKRHSVLFATVEGGHYFEANRTKPYWGHLQDSSWTAMKERYIDDLYDRVDHAKIGMNRYQDDPSKAFQSAVYTKVFFDYF